VHVTTISLDPANPVRAELPAGGDGTAVDLYRDGRRISRLSAPRTTPGALTVLETPSP
jgi:hypothetical protein